MALAAGISADAGAMTGMDLRDNCRNVEREGVNVDDYGPLSCVAYLRGWMDGFLVAQPQDESLRATCIPITQLQPKQFVILVQKFVYERPDLLHKPATLVAFWALTTAFPCPR